MSEDNKPYKIKVVTKLVYDNTDLKKLDNMSKFLYPNIASAIRRIYAQ
jgi:hypothetical protein